MRDQKIMNCQHLTKPKTKHNIKKREDIDPGEALGKGREINKLFINSFGLAYFKCESTLKKKQKPTTQKIIYRNSGKISKIRIIFLQVYVYYTCSSKMFIIPYL